MVNTQKASEEEAYSHLQRGINDNRHTMCSVTGSGWVTQHIAIRMKRTYLKCQCVVDVSAMKRSVLNVAWNAFCRHCIHANALCIFICSNLEGLTDKLPRLLFGPFRGGAGSGLEQWGLCVGCPQDSKHYSSVPGSRSWGFMPQYVGGSLGSSSLVVVYSRPI